MNGYRKIYKYRKSITGAIALTLLAKNFKHNLLPEYLLLPYTASLECTRYPGEYQRWLIRIAQRDSGYQGQVFPFVTNGINCVSGGFEGVGPVKPVGYIGIPRTFYCGNMIEVSDIDLRFIAGKRISPTSKTEEKFLESLVLSDAAQKYSVATHLMYLKGNWALAEAVISPAFAMLGYALCFYAPRVIFKGVEMSVVSFFRWQLIALAATYFLCKVAWAQYYQVRNLTVANQAASISEEYAQGAVECLQKERDFNVACRILLGQKGERLYTALGNRKDGLVMNWNGPSTTDLERNAKKILQKFTLSKEKNVELS